ncbi:MAG: DUF2459 domain-containing protein [Alphaproteobacteria bacterium]|nr:DUF2459 domain-containing protein [Alphaproteobacteria bacterium]
MWAAVARASLTAARAAGLAVLLTLVLSVAALGWRMAAPIRVAPTPVGPCTEIGLDTNGWHTDLVMPAAIFPEDHPFRRLYPDARRFSVGWGDRDAYRFADKDPWLNVAAIIPPSASAVHVSADAPATGPFVAISEDGARALVAHIDRTLRIDARGRLIRVDEGYRPDSVFVESGAQFHVFRLCNQWVAEGLRAAGLPVSPLGAWTAASVVRQIRNGPRCPPPRIRIAPA